MHPSDSDPPAFRAPQGACDAHFHVFGPAEKYPYASAEPLRYAPPHAPLEDYLRLAKNLGLTRFAFVQPSAYGRDNACMLDAMRATDPAIRRGIVDVDEDAPDALLAGMDALGVRGVRINVSPVKPRTADLAASMLPRIRRMGARCAELGWHLDFLTPGWLTEALLPEMQKLPCGFSIAHMGMFLAKDGPAQPGFARLLAMIADGSLNGWVKFTGTYRMATAPDFADALPMARAVIAAIPDRILWGSDYPHLSFAHAVGSVPLFNLLGDWADAAQRRKILVDNPARLFGF